MNAEASLFAHSQSAVCICSNSNSLCRLQLATIFRTLNPLTTFNSIPFTWEKGGEMRRKRGAAIVALNNVMARLSKQFRNSCWLLDAGLLHIL